ncbi:MAG: thioredoxin domain-containing protein [Chitinophagales bacterium]|nr:thioredoxin domain-containing protein [Chitinophagales bacterium]
MKLFSFIVAVLLFAVSCNSQSSDQVLNAAAFKDKIAQTKDAEILDVRTPEEYAGGYIENAKNINYNGSEFKSEVEKLDKNKTYFVYCLSGARSASAASYMRSNGFKHVINLEGGILAWQSQNLPLASETAAAVADKISAEAYTQMITSDTAVLVDYYAPWCAPCLKMKPMLEEISKEYAGKVKVIRLNIDENKGLAQQLNITAIPVLKKFEKGKETWSHEGYIEKAALVKAL